jgi:hypothetical protein
MLCSIARRPLKSGYRGSHLAHHHMDDPPGPVFEPRGAGEGAAAIIKVQVPTLMNRRVQNNHSFYAAHPYRAVTRGSLFYSCLITRSVATLPSLSVILSK